MQPLTDPDDSHKQKFSNREDEAKGLTSFPLL